MRHRQRSHNVSYVGLIRLSLNEKGIGSSGTSYYSSDSYNPWGGQPGPYVLYESDIYDDLSPENVRIRPFNNCTHTWYKSARIAGSKGLTFTPPTKPCFISVDHGMLYRPTIPTSTAPWSSMADELASLAAGSTDHSSMLAVSLLEGAKTIEMMRNPFNLLKPSFRRRVGKLTARTLAKRGSDVWLEGYYGWKSFAQDVNQIAQATAYFLNDTSSSILEELGEKLTVRRKIVNFSSRTDYALGTSESSWSAKSSAGWVEYGQLMSGHSARVVDHSCSTSYTLGCRQVMESKARIATTRRFLSAVGLTSWRSIRDTIWEVIPFSFVIDWFIDSRGIWAPLNKWRLSQMDIRDLGYSTKVLGQYGVELYISPNVTYNVPPWSARPITQSVNVIRGTGGEYGMYNRNVGYPPNADVPSLCLGKGLSFIRGINGAALITQLLSKPRR